MEAAAEHNCMRPRHVQRRGSCEPRVCQDVTLNNETPVVEYLKSADKQWSAVSLLNAIHLDLVKVPIWFTSHHCRSIGGRGQFAGHAPSRFMDRSSNFARQARPGSVGIV